MTVAEFKVAFPAFVNTPTADVQARLTVAERQTPASVWDDDTDRDECIGLRTAIALAQEPGGRDMQLQPDGRTVYHERLALLESAQVGGGRAL